MRILKLIRIPAMIFGVSIVLLFYHLTGKITEHTAFCWLLFSIHLMLKENKK